MKTSERRLVTPPKTEILDKVVQELRRKICKDQFETWFRGFGLEKADAREVLFSVPNGFLRDWITRNYMPILQHAVAKATSGSPNIRVCLTVGKDTGSPPPADKEPAVVLPAVPVEPPVPTAATPVPTTATPVEKQAGPGNMVHSDDAWLNSNYTFDEFVVGPCNRLAHAAALAIGANPGRSYNPFFVHGKVGLGKTHLLQAICHAIVRAQPNSRVLFLSCEEFTNRFIDSIQNRTLSQFREYHRNADVLVIDDVEFLANKTQTQEEFFHTFNALYHRQKQIVLSSDCTPPEIPTLPDRLVSRFKWGLEADMTQPCFETRAAIVRRKARIRSQELPNDVVHLLAETITSNIRELEGAVTKVLGLSTITDHPINLELAGRALRDGAAVRSRQITLSDVMDLITSEFSISAKDLTSKRRTQVISLPRQIGMFLSRQHTDHSLEEVGRFFGNRDHTTVLYAVNKINDRSGQDRMFQELLGGLSQRLQSGNFERRKR